MNTITCKKIGPLGYAGLLLSTALTIQMGFALAATEASSPKTMTVEQQTVVNITVPQSDLKVDLWTDRGNGVYVDGERARVFLKVNQTARVELVDVNSSGVKTVLFPNACQPNNVLTAGQTVEVGVGKSGNTVCPGIAVSGPYGLSVLKAIATTDQSVKLVGSTSSKSSGGPFGQLTGNADAYAKSMTVIVNQAPTAKWSTASWNYSVVPAQTTATNQQPQQTSQVTITTGSAGGTVQVVVPSTSGQTVAVTQPGAAVTVSPTTTPAVIAPAYPLPQIRSDFGLQLQVGESNYKVGDKLEFSVSAERRCDLRVLNIDHKGEVSVLYPNSLHPTITLKAGKTEFFPSSKKELELNLTGEPGTQTLLAVCAQNKSFWETLTGKSVSTAAKPTMTIEQILNDKGDGLVGRKAVTYSLLP